MENLRYFTVGDWIFDFERMVVYPTTNIRLHMYRGSKRLFSQYHLNWFEIIYSKDTIKCWWPGKKAYDRPFIENGPEYSNKIDQAYLKYLVEKHLLNPETN